MSGIPLKAEILFRLSSTAMYWFFLYDLYPLLLLQDLISLIFQNAFKKTIAVCPKALDKSISYNLITLSSKAIISICLDMSFFFDQFNGKQKTTQQQRRLQSWKVTHKNVCRVFKAALLIFRGLKTKHWYVQQQCKKLFWLKYELVACLNI